jgi:acetyl esterase
MTAPPNTSLTKQIPSSRISAIIPLFLLILSLFSLAHAQRVKGPAGKVYTYKETDEGKRELEVYFPKGHSTAKKPVPAIIFFHGGGWGGGSRDVFKYQCAYFASRGIVAATVTYRLATKKAKAAMKGKGSHKRLCIPDAKSAIRWVKQHADELGVDPDRLIISGGSAGGHIGLIATSNPSLNHPDDPEGFDTSVAAMVLFNPALSVDDAKDSEIDFIQHLKPGAPPAIAFFGSKDKWLKGWNPTYAKWKSLEKSVIEVQIAEGQGHAFFNSQPWADLTLVAADQFLQEQGLLKGAPTLPKPPGGEKLDPAAK